MNTWLDLIVIQIDRMRLRALWLAESFKELNEHEEQEDEETTIIDRREQNVQNQ